MTKTILLLTLCPLAEITGCSRLFLQQLLLLLSGGILSPGLVGAGGKLNTFGPELWQSNINVPVGTKTCKNNTMNKREIWLIQMWLQNETSIL